MISGIAGGDVIVDGFGADELRGNDGADLFRYLDVRDTNDTIHDFAPGSDKIDLSNVNVGGDAYHFDAPVGARTFTAARNLIRFYDGSNTVILSNTDGDLSTAGIHARPCPAIRTCKASDFLLCRAALDFRAA